ncbi:MAG: 50S ribosomal protein L29 [Chloroflexota bacterium]
MPASKANNPRLLSREEQQKQLADAHQELFNLRFQLSTRQLQNYRRIHEVRRTIARLLTIMHQQLEGAE